MYESAVAFEREDAAGKKFQLQFFNLELEYGAGILWEDGGKNPASSRSVWSVSLVGQSGQLTR